MAHILVDSNVLLDVITEDAHWFDWSAARLEALAERHVLVINPIIYAEVSVRYRHIEELEAALPREDFQREPLPWEAGFLAGKCFLRYRRAGGIRRSPLPDFFIGAHALVGRMALLTRDRTRYETYFKSLQLIAPE
ncbi:MAG TPA: type II toxin-antitoxin system VapC family toxin [Gammaproteobacteria bacterium]|nr:type II toxin-antitoxin system VapC family toxin [Gammaproteobacteria bacterium]